MEEEFNEKMQLINKKTEEINNLYYEIGLIKKDCLEKYKARSMLDIYAIL